MTKWICCTPDDQAELEAYTLDQLDALDEPTEREIEFTRDYLPLFQATQPDIILRPMRQRERTHPRRRGRQKGDIRDYREVEWQMFFDVLEPLGRIEFIWKRDFKKIYRSHRNPPTKWDILAVRYGPVLNLKRFQAFYKNHRILARSRIS